MATIAITAATTDAEIATLHFDVRDIAIEARDYAVYKSLADRHGDVLRR